MCVFSISVSEIVCFYVSALGDALCRIPSHEVVGEEPSDSDVSIYLNLQCSV